MKKIVAAFLTLVLLLGFGSTALADVPTVSNASGAFPSFNYLSAQNRWYVTQNASKTTYDVSGVQFDVKLINPGDSLNGIGIFNNDTTIVLDKDYNYVFDGQSLCDRSNFALIGEGPVQLSKTVTAAYGLGFSASSNVLIKNIEFNMVNPGVSVDYYLMLAGTSENIYIDNVKVLPFINPGVWIANQRQIGLNINGSKHVYVNDFSAVDINTCTGRGTIQIANSSDVNFTGTTTVGSNNIIIEKHNGSLSNGIKFSGTVTANSFMIDDYQHTDVVLPMDYQFAGCFPTGMVITNAFAPITEPSVFGVVDLVNLKWIAADGMFGAGSTVNDVIAKIDQTVANNNAPGAPGLDIKVVYPTLDTIALPAGTQTFILYAVGSAGGNISSMQSPDLSKPVVDANGNNVSLNNYDFRPLTEQDVLASLISNAGNVSFNNCLFATPPPPAPASVAPTITTTSLPNGTVSAAYSQALAATGTAPITWSLESGSLPAGLTLSATGAITGTPTAAGASTFTVKALNIAGSVTKQFTITISAPAPAPNTYSGSNSSSGSVDMSRWYALNGYNPDGTKSGSPAAGDAVPYAAPTIDGIGLGNTTAKKIPVYQKESTKSKKLLTIADVDSEVKILGVSKGFAYVEVDGVKGYIQLSRLNIGFTVRPTYITKAKTKAYSESGMKKAQLLTTIAKNEEVGMITLFKGSKACIEYDGQELWVSFGNLKLAPLA